MFAVFFFFSSRRRHTRFSRDWSSDVCSSDLDLGLNERTSSPIGPCEREHMRRVSPARAECTEQSEVVFPGVLESRQIKKIRPIEPQPFTRGSHPQIDVAAGRKPLIV